MKTIFCALCFLCASAAFGQSAPVLTNTPQPLQMFEHPQHASEHALAPESSLFSCSTYSYAQGERPLAEFGEAPRYEIPLGDIARAFRKEHSSSAKLAKVLEK
jgi:hypothetical protein